jgi:hypothetical protein
VNWLAQDIYCRFVASEGLTPKGAIQQIAQTCITLSIEFFAVLGKGLGSGAVGGGQTGSRDHRGIHSFLIARFLRAVQVELR